MAGWAGHAKGGTDVRANRMITGGGGLTERQQQQHDGGGREFGLKHDLMEADISRMKRFMSNVRSTLGKQNVT